MLISVARVWQLLTTVEELGDKRVWLAAHGGRERSQSLKGQIKSQRYELAISSFRKGEKPRRVFGRNP